MKFRFKLDPVAQGVAVVHWSTEDVVLPGFGEERVVSAAGVRDFYWVALVEFRDWFIKFREVR